MPSSIPVDRDYGRRRVAGLLLGIALVLATAASASARGIPPLHEAAATGNADVVNAWIAAKRNLDAPYDEPSTGIEGNYARMRGLTALMLAARAGHLEIVKRLVEAGANLYAESRLRDGSDPRSAFDHAVDGRHRAIVEYLWARSDGMQFARRLDRHIAATCALACTDKAGGDARSNLALMLIGFARDDAVRGRGISEAACYAREPLRVLAFLDKHAVRFPRNTLHCIAYHPVVRGVRSMPERIAVASFLLDRGADPNDLPHTPLRGAAAAHDVEMVELLLARGGNVNLPNADGMTPLEAAANTCTYGGTAAQLEPIQRRQLTMIEHLLRAGAHVTPAASAGGRLHILSQCCRRGGLTPIQRRICEVFALP
jgi:ankyrin repeat protein